MCVILIDNEYRNFNKHVHVKLVKWFKGLCLLITDVWWNYDCCPWKQAFAVRNRQQQTNWKVDASIASRSMMHVAHTNRNTTHARHKCIGDPSILVVFGPGHRPVHNLILIRAEARDWCGIESTEWDANKVITQLFSHFVQLCIH